MNLIVSKIKKYVLLLVSCLSVTMVAPEIARAEVIQPEVTNEDKSKTEESKTEDNTKTDYKKTGDEVKEKKDPDPTVDIDYIEERITISGYNGTSIDFQKVKNEMEEPTKWYSVPVVSGSAFIDISPMMSKKSFKIYVKFVGCENGGIIYTVDPIRKLKNDHTEIINKKLYLYDGKDNAFLGRDCEYRIGTRNHWKDLNDNFPYLVDTLKATGSTLYIRLKATYNDPVSNVLKFKIPKQPSAPKVKFVSQTQSVKLKKGMEYRLNYKGKDDQGWIQANSDQVLDFSDKLERCILEVRTYQTEKKFASAISVVEIPERKPLNK